MAIEVDLNHYTLSDEERSNMRERVRMMDKNERGYIRWHFETNGHLLDDQRPEAHWRLLLAEIVRQEQEKC